MILWSILWTAGLATAFVAGFSTGRLNRDNRAEAQEGEEAPRKTRRKQEEKREGQDYPRGRSARMREEQQEPREVRTEPREPREMRTAQREPRQMRTEQREPQEMRTAQRDPEGKGTVTRKAGEIRVDARNGRLQRSVIRTMAERKIYSRKDRQREEDVVSWSVGSPVFGEVTDMQEDYPDHPTIVIQPCEDKLYAPTGGKIVKLFPMGNEFLFRTEFGAELHIQVGNIQDELSARYYRPRIVQNEIVGKGKLLLEFDRAKLAAEGGSQVSVTLESSTYGSEVFLTAEDLVRTGEEILRLQEPCRVD